MSQMFQTAAPSLDPGETPQYIQELIDEQTPQYSHEQEARQLRKKVAELEQEVSQNWQTMQKILEQTEKIQAKNEVLQNENRQLKEDAKGMSQKVLQTMQRYIDETNSCCEGMIHRAEQEVADIHNDAQAKSEQLLRQAEKEQNRRLVEATEQIRQMKAQAKRQTELRTNQLVQAKRLMQCLQEYMEEDAPGGHGENSEP